MKKSIILSCLLMGAYIPVQAQKIKQIAFSLQKESVAFPFTRFLPFHPGAQIGLTLNNKEREKSITNLNVNLGGYYHKKVANAVYFQGEYAYRPVLKSIVSIDFVGSLGYMHTFYPGEVYALNPDNREFGKITQTGRPHILAGLGIGFTYLKNDRWQPFINQNLSVKVPFGNGLANMVHSFLKVGAIYKLSK